MRRNEILTAFFIAKKNIIKNRKSLFLTIFIISLGFISSIIIYGVLKDVSHDLQENFIETNMGHVILEPYDNNEKIETIDNVLAKIKVLPNILGISSITKKSARLYDKNNNYIDTEIYIINPEEFSKTSVVDDLMKEGSWLNKGEKDKIILGCINVENCNNVKAFNSIDVGVGESIRSLSNGYPEFELTLKGIYQHRYNEIEIISYITQETAKTIFLDYNSKEADEIIILLSDRSHSKEMVAELSKMNLNVEILTWEDKSSMFSSIVDSFSVIGNISFFIGILISAISIYVILYINILNKKTQIGIIKAIGIKSKVISLSYILLSFFLGIIGSIVGIILTLSMVEYFKFNPIKTGIGDLVPQVTLSLLFLVGTTIILASVISGYIVSKRITKQNIIEAIFHG
jgi:putative ABC transport system permease protein